MEETIFTRIKKETVENALDRVIKDLNDLTNGELQKALELATEFFELSLILKEKE